MSEEPKLVAEKRVKFGSAESRRLRKAGRVPGIVYGHGEESIGFAADADVLDRIVHTGHHVVDLELEGNSETAMFRDVQWDTFGNRVLHFDLIRVSRGEKVEVEVDVELHGNSPGSLAGGVLEQPVRTLLIECPALQIPDKFEVNVNELEIGDSILVSQVEVPDYVTVLTPATETVVQVSEPQEVPELEEEEEAPSPVEPELVGEGEEEETSAEEEG